MTTLSDAELRPGIRWGRAIVGGLLLELLLSGFAGLLYGLDRLEDLNTYILPATLLAAVLAGAWTARGTARPVLNGALAGVAALALYVLLAIVAGLLAPDRADFTTALSPLYLASHALKVLGGALGGWWVARKRA